MKTRSRVSIITGAIVLAVALLWLPFAVPRLVRLPGDLDVTNHYTGAFTAYVNPANGQPLNAPLSVPMTIDRHVYAVDGAVGAERALVKDESNIDIAGSKRIKASTYLIDRRSMENVPDPRSGVDQADTYSINLPFSASSTDTYSMWKAETGVAYPLSRATGARTTTIDGVRLLRMKGAMPATPVTDAERQSLAAQGLPMQMTADQLLARLGNAVPPASAAALKQAITTPIPLVYSWSSTGDALVEGRTGMIVSVTNVVEKLTVQLDLSGHPALAPFASLNTPTSIYDLRYSQTPASVAERVDDAKDSSRMIRLVQSEVPGGMAIAGLLLLFYGFISSRRRPSEPAVVAVPEKAAPPKAA